MRGQIFFFYYYKHRINRHFYAEKASRKHSFLLRQSTGLAETKNGVKFKTFPGIFVFPGLCLVSCKLFMTGLVKSAVSLLLNDECTGTCKAVSAFCFAGPVGFAAFGFWAIADIMHRFRRGV